MAKTDQKPHRGYIEGYYGRLLNWPDRHGILKTLADNNMDSYFYAPKEDPCHRLDWRRPYDDDWRENFRRFTKQAADYNIKVIAGIAPGIDFNFGHLDQDPKNGDLERLINKAHQLIDDGAHAIGLLMDDLDGGFITNPNRGSFNQEGIAHATLANLLAEAVDVPVNMTPRIYADDIIDDAASDAQGYLSDFAKALNPEALVFTCGTHIVAHDFNLDDTGIVKAGIAPERLIIWDNYYANDYCPRRLFVGPWRYYRSGLGNHLSVMLNPTGMVKTDQMLLDVMAAENTETAWQKTLTKHGVPLAFFGVAPAFLHPPHPDGREVELNNPEKMLAALDELLWRWQTPLSREWYPFLMGLKQDIMLMRGEVDALRRAKTLPPPLNTIFRGHDDE